LNQSEYIKTCYNIKESNCPHFDLEEEFAIQLLIKNLIKSNLILSAHDTAEGGLFMALMESCMHKNLGMQISNISTLRDDVFLLSESQSRVIVSVAPENENKFLEIVKDTSCLKLGIITSGRLMICNQDFGSIHDWKKLHEETLSSLIEN
ncbi:MAG: phosphoribosylformylglycinamidine synthase subunit PurL, partial [Bacteroidota bacterium]